MKFFPIFATLFLAGAARAASLQFSSTNSTLPTPMTGHEAVYDGQDTIYIIGGGSGRVWKYSLTTEKITSAGKFLPLYYGGAVISRNGSDIYWLGGGNEAGEPSTGIYRWSTSRGNYSLIANLAQFRQQLAVAWDSDKEAAFLMGGSVSQYYSTQFVARYTLGEYQPYDVSTFYDPNPLGAAATWSFPGGEAFLFGGDSQYATEYNRTTIHKFNFYSVSAYGTGKMERLNAALVSPVYGAKALAANDGEIYIPGADALIHFDSTTYKSQALTVTGYPTNFSDYAAAYVPKLDRIYVFGGVADSVARDEIAYIDLGSQLPALPTGPIASAVNCSDGVTRVAQDPTCCESVIVCHAGTETKLECPTGQQFNGAKSQCEDAVLVGCKITV